MDEKVIRLLFKNYGRKEKSGERHLNTPGEMAHCKVLTKNKDLSSIPKTHAMGDEARLCTFVIPALGQGRQENLWYSLVSQPRQICGSQNVRDPASKRKVHSS